jgi:hypothetical protein
MTNQFVACKQSIDGTRKQWGHIFNLTANEARCAVRFPLGLQEEKSEKFVWVYYHSPSSKAS